MSLYVYIKEPIDWQYEKRPKGNELIWTKEDAEKYGNHTSSWNKSVYPAPGIK